MPIANYSTTVAATVSFGEITGMLVRAKAQAVMSEYNDDGQMTHIAFRLPSPHGVLSYRLPANLDGVLKAMQADKKVPRSACTKAQAERTAWRILKDWLRAQLAIHEAQIAGLDQLLFAHVQTNTGETVYERFQSQGKTYLLG